ncbi:MAG TPA: hypothetical protein G4O00_09830 [Thermoflexia bacterium]|jgi:hypothetical protein|nr:hypothetical protein [Thermoflexia bacterium]
MASEGVHFLSPDRARYLVEVAERAREELGRWAGQRVNYDATALQLLDEWIEHVVRSTPSPPPSMQVLWTAFLGEVFRRRYQGEWVVREDDGKALGVLCPMEAGGLHVVEVARQVRRRIQNGFADSLALFYVREGALLRGQVD